MDFLSASETRALDAAAIAAGTPGSVLMERAGFAAFRFLTQICAPKARRFLILGGLGNNGGDAWVVARYLKQAGFHCDLVLLGEERNLRGDAIFHYDRLAAVGLTPVKLNEPAAVLRYLDFWKGDIIVDGLVGTGFKGGASALLSAAIQGGMKNGAKIFSLDLPSGLPADGDEPRYCFKADWTVTFGSAKKVLLTKFSEYCGRTEVIDIGWPPSEKEAWRALSYSEAQKLFPKPSLQEHKHSRGHLLLLAGSAGMGGAALLAAEAAAKAGVGLVTAAIPEALTTAFNARLPHILTLPLKGDPAEDATALSLLFSRCDAAAVGPGWYPDDYHFRLLKLLNEAGPARQVWDAGALSLLAENELTINREILLTPHEGEFRALMGTLPPKDDPGRVEAAFNLAEKYNATVILKGYHSVACAPGNNPYINLSGNPSLASAGTGDVLTGIAGALLAQDVPTLEAAALAAYFQGLAGDLSLAYDGSVTAVSLLKRLGKAFSL